MAVLEVRCESPYERRITNAIVPRKLVVLLLATSSFAQSSTTITSLNRGRLSMASREAFGGDVSWAEHWIVRKEKACRTGEYGWVLPACGPDWTYLRSPLAAAVSKAGGLMSFSAEPSICITGRDSLPCGL